MDSEVAKFLKNKEFSDRLRSDIQFFAEEILGIPFHPGQVKWIEGATTKINILRPGNRWGKTFLLAVTHIWQLMTKRQLKDNMLSPQEWLDQPYETLNFGPGYEQAREVPRLMKEIIEGQIILPKSMHEKWGRKNNSKLKGWAILSDRVERQSLPELQLQNGAKVLIRSYSEMGAAFKAKALAYISGDECADIAELWTFTNNTLLPRLVSLGGKLDFAGTVQPDGYDYMMMIEVAEEEMRSGKEKPNLYVQKGRMYDNIFLDPEEIQKIEEVADEEIRKQIIEGEYVEKGDKYFGYERIKNAGRKNIGWLDEGFPGRKYVLSADFSGSDKSYADWTVLQVWDYTTEPYQMVYFWRIKGNHMSIPMQYEKVGEVKEKFPGKLIIDGTSLGGKNAQAFLRHLRPIVVDILAKSKQEMLQALKHAFDGGRSDKYKRKLVRQRDGSYKDRNPDWGLLRWPYNPVIEHEMMNYRLDDKKIKQDIVMTMAMAIWWIELRRPKHPKNYMVPMDFF